MYHLSEALVPTTSGALDLVQKRTNLCKATIAAVVPSHDARMTSDGKW